MWILRYCMHDGFFVFLLLWPNHCGSVVWNVYRFSCVEKASRIRFSMIYLFKKIFFTDSHISLSRHLSTFIITSSAMISERVRTARGGVVRERKLFAERTPSGRKFRSWEKFSSAKRNYCELCERFRKYFKFSVFIVLKCIQVASFSIKCGKKFHLLLS